MVGFAITILVVAAGFLFNQDSSSAIVAAADYFEDFALSSPGLDYVPQSGLEELSKNKVIYIRHGKSGNNAISNPMIGFYFKEAYDPELLEEGWTQCREK